MLKKSFFKRKIFYIPAILIVLIGGGFFAFGPNGEAKFETQVVEAGMVTHIVNETGTVESADDISLSFARSGRVAQVLVSKGDVVSKGDTLAVLENGSLNADLRQAEAALALEKASVEKTGIEFKNAESSLANSITDAYVKADDAIQAKADQLFSNPESSKPYFGIEIVKDSTTFFIGSSVAKSQDINSLRSQVETELNNLEKIVFSKSFTNVEQVALDTEKTLQNVQKLLSLIASSLNEYVAEDTSVQTVYEGFKADISAARSSTNTALTTLRSSLQAYYTSKASIQTSGNIVSSVQLRDIRIEDAQAKVDGIKSHINDGYIISPIAGSITDILINTGEIASAASGAISLISAGNLEISVNIPEDDIAFVDVGDKANVTFDAYDNAVFEAEVVFISPKAELIDGVPMFEVVLEFKDQDPRIKAGLSVDVDIVAEEKENVLSIPSRAVVEEDGERFVRIMVGTNSYRKQSVTLGLRGDNGHVEITLGLEAGNNVITFVNGDIDSLTEIK